MNENKRIFGEQTGTTRINEVRLFDFVPILSLRVSERLAKPRHVRLHVLRLNPKMDRDLQETNMN